MGKGKEGKGKAKNGSASTTAHGSRGGKDVASKGNDKAKDNTQWAVDLKGGGNGPSGQCGKGDLEKTIAEETTEARESRQRASETQKFRNNDFRTISLTLLRPKDISNYSFEI